MLALLLTHTYFNVVYSNGIKDKSLDVARGSRVRSQASLVFRTRLLTEIPSPYDPSC